MNDNELDVLAKEAGAYIYGERDNPYYDFTKEQLKAFVAAVRYQAGHAPAAFQKLNTVTGQWEEISKEAYDQLVEHKDTGIRKLYTLADLTQYRDLIGFALWQAINLPETDPRRDYIRQANELVELTEK